MDRNSQFFTRNIVIVISVIVAFVMLVITGIVLIIGRNTQTPPVQPNGTITTTVQPNPQTQSASRDELVKQVGRQTYDELLQQMRDETLSDPDNLVYRNNTLSQSGNTTQFIIDNEQQESSYLIQLIPAPGNATPIIIISCAPSNLQTWGSTRCSTVLEIDPPLEEL